MFLLPFVGSNAASLSEWEDFWFHAVEDGLVNTLSHVRSLLPFPDGVDHRSISGHSAAEAHCVSEQMYTRLQGETALHCAIRNGKFKVAVWLVEHAGANPMQAYEVFLRMLPRLTRMFLHDTDDT